MSATDVHVPVALPLLDVTIGDEGQITITLDGQPYGDTADLDRSGIQQVVDDITAARGPMRVHVTEHDGTEFTDIALPHHPDAAGKNPDTKDLDEEDHAPGRTPPTARTMATGITGTGLLPEEDVHLALVIATDTADRDGAVQVRLPAAVLTRTDAQLLLVGATSGHTTVCVRPSARA
ncbi:hypothetical protein [Nocardioides sambongensis]|uniref:hypothetical protein n=1 Tax=Nocardioides sambongensis TaxID=2589074 RepID=UPI00112E77A0|nr:hypothetical protein [Nocardioides sambongensis]